MAFAQRLLGNRMNPHSRERALLTSALFWQTRGPVSAPYGVDWEWILWAAQAYGIGGVAHRGIRGADRVEPRLAELFEQTVARNVLLQSVLEDVCVALDSREIKALLIKGAAIWEALALEPGHRHLDDVDILIDPSRVRDVAAMIASLGGRPLRRVLPDGTLRPPVAHSIGTFVFPTGGVVDVHLRLPHIPSWRQADFDAQWRRGRATTPARSVHVPSLEDILEQLCAHVLINNHADALHLPRHIADLDLFDQRIGLSNLVHDASPPHVRTSWLWMRKLRDEPTSCVHPLGPCLFRTDTIHESRIRWHARVQSVKRVITLAARNPNSLRYAVLPAPEYLGQSLREPAEPLQKPWNYVSGVTRRILRFLTGRSA